MNDRQWKKQNGMYILLSPAIGAFDPIQTDTI